MSHTSVTFSSVLNRKRPPFSTTVCFTSRCSGFSLSLKLSLLCRLRKGHVVFERVLFFTSPVPFLFHAWYVFFYGLFSETCLVELSHTVGEMTYSSKMSLTERQQYGLSSVIVSCCCCFFRVQSGNICYCVHWTSCVTLPQIHLNTL